ncbi:hypothetical protein NUU61_002775 [Penicillium alfredii]|uniref:Uncharacterized protein n=1 Tax=Penicillium alfredii TaxID=1506179 RepID=A0A9W9FS86_9EURO|nr:uncharacterized protein NUU61_002775 [Penicillium alfredii]KAJ5105428.1 hypothetical protein NUU61_002775 [Penicillium alfredii]
MEPIPTADVTSISRRSLAPSNTPLYLSRGGNVTQGQILHHAVNRDSDAVDVLKLLIARGTPINALLYQNHQPSWNMNFFMGETPLHKAVFLRKLDVIHYLLSEGVDLNILDVRNHSDTMRRWADSKRNHGNVRVLAMAPYAISYVHASRLPVYL